MVHQSHSSYPRHNISTDERHRRKCSEYCSLSDCCPKSKQRCERDCNTHKSSICLRIPISCPKPKPRCEHHGVRSHGSHTHCNEHNVHTHSNKPTHAAHTHDNNHTHAHTHDNNHTHDAHTHDNNHTHSNCHDRTHNHNVHIHDNNHTHSNCHDRTHNHNVHIHDNNHTHSNCHDHTHKLCHEKSSCAHPQHEHHDNQISHEPSDKVTRRFLTHELDSSGEATHLLSMLKHHKKTHMSGHVICIAKDVERIFEQMKKNHPNAMKEEHKIIHATKNDFDLKTTDSSHHHPLSIFNHFLKHHKLCWHKPDGHINHAGHNIKLKDGLRMAGFSLKLPNMNIHAYAHPNHNSPRDDATFFNEVTTADGTFAAYVKHHDIPHDH